MAANNLDNHPQACQPLPPSSSPFLRLPAELRLKIYHEIISPAATLTLRSLFIRQSYTNLFMTQQPKHQLGTSTGIFRTCKLIAAETLPILYGLPRWACGCRVEALACQIGAANFRRIRTMGVDVDDLDLVVERVWSVGVRDRGAHRYSWGTAGTEGQMGEEYAMQSVPVRLPAAFEIEGDDGGGGFHGGPMFGTSRGGRRGGTFVVSGSMVAKTLDFSNLEVLEVEGFQSAALSRRGTHRVRVEALRLCELAVQLLAFHPKLRFLLQRGSRGDGGADARDLTLGRVRWRFVKELPEGLAVSNVGDGPSNSAVDGEQESFDETDSAGRDREHIVDLAAVRALLEFALKEDERAIASGASLPVAWTSSETGRFNLYPFLQAA